MKVVDEGASGVHTDDQHTTSRELAIFHTASDQRIDRQAVGEGIGAMLVDRSAAMVLERVCELDADRERRLSESLATVNHSRDEVMWRATESANARVRDFDANRDRHLTELLKVFVGMDSLLANQSATWDPSCLVRVTQDVIAPFPLG